MSYIPVMHYLGGLAAFGFLRWLLDGILGYIKPLSETGNVYTLLNYLWAGLVIAYLILGSLWLVRKYSEREYYQP